MSFVRRLPIAAVAFALVACTPALNWREARPQGAGIRMLFPCRPDRHERTIHIGDLQARMQMHSCGAAQAVFSIAFFDVTDPARVTPTLRELRSLAAANVAGRATGRPIAVVGATPNEESALVRIDGSLPDGRRVIERSALFVHGLRLYQATALGGSLDADSLETFFGSIQVVP